MRLIKDIADLELLFYVKPEIDPWKLPRVVTVPNAVSIPDLQPQQDKPTLRSAVITPCPPIGLPFLERKGEN